MTLPDRQSLPRLRLAGFSFLLIALLAALFAVSPPDGLEGAPWAQFLGRFHLLTVHFPIALILLVPILELAGKHTRLPQLRASVDFLWVLAMFSSLAAATLGWCLARNGAYSGRLVTQHMWGGLSVAAGCWCCWMVRAHLRTPQPGPAYALCLAAVVGLVSWTGYRGGQLTQGENHLTEQMPRPLRRLFGLPLETAAPPRANPAFFYGAHIEPIFVKHCYECHSVDKQKGRLRLDSFEALMRGGKHGVVIRAGDVKQSELYRRVTLQPSDDDAMPPQGKQPLTANELKLLELWIAAGASTTVPADGIKGAPTDAGTPAAEVTFPEFDADAVAKARAGIDPQLAKISQGVPGVLDYESRGSVDLVLHASALGERFKDDGLAALTPLLGQIIVADLSGTAITDSSAAVLAGMKRLRTLRLANTKITDTTVLALGSLNQLEMLSLYGTPVTPEGLKALQSLPKLKHIYVGATKIPADIALPDDFKAKLVF